MSLKTVLKWTFFAVLFLLLGNMSAGSTAPKVHWTKQNVSSIAPEVCTNQGVVKSVWLVNQNDRHSELHVTCASGVIILVQP